MKVGRAVSLALLHAGLLKHPVTSETLDEVERVVALAIEQALDETAGVRRDGTPARYAAAQRCTEVKA